MSKLKVFVYGTLKPGESNYHRYCAGKVVEQKPAIAYGQLFHLSLGYPAMTLGNGRVYGYLLTFTDLNILGLLDKLEDYEPNRPSQENEYNRQLLEIYDLKGKILGSAWTYLMTDEQVQFYHGVAVISGSWSSTTNLFTQ
ncbi:MAG: gamma-glutamylcyclotransferase [Coleofasciculaceae cyanobacterium]